MLARELRKLNVTETETVQVVLLYSSKAITLAMIVGAAGSSMAITGGVHVPVALIVDGALLSRSAPLTCTCRGTLQRRRRMCVDVVDSGHAQRTRKWRAKKKGKRVRSFSIVAFFFYSRIDLDDVTRQGT